MVSRDFKFGLAMTAIGCVLVAMLAWFGYVMTHAYVTTLDDARYRFGNDGWQLVVDREHGVVTLTKRLAR